MAWVRLDDAAPEHPKFLLLAKLANQGDRGAAAAWLWVCGLGYCNRQSARDGVIPRMKVPQLYPVRGALGLAGRLVEVGLWETHQDGYVIHDYHDYQPGLLEALELSSKRSAAGRKGGQRSGAARAATAGQSERTDGAPMAHRQSDAQAAGGNGETNQHTGEANCLKQTNPRPDPSRPVPDPVDQHQPPLQLFALGGSTLAPDVVTEGDLEQVYRRYPRKEGKAKGMKLARKEITTRALLGDLARAVDTYAAQISAEGRELRYIQHFATFMACWRDYLEPSPDGSTVDNRGPQERALDEYTSARERLRCGRGEPGDDEIVARWREAH